MQTDEGHTVVDLRLFFSSTGLGVIIFICNRPMATKLGKVVTYRERLQPFKSHDLTLVT